MLLFPSSSGYGRGFQCTRSEGRALLLQCAILHSTAPAAHRAPPGTAQHRWQQIHAFFACAAYLQSQTADSTITIFQKTSIKMHIIRSKTCSTLKEWDSTLPSSILGPSALQRSQIVLNILTFLHQSNLRSYSAALHIYTCHLSTDLRVDIYVIFTNTF